MQKRAKKIISYKWDYKKKIRGQITIFILITLLIVLGLVAFFYFKDRTAASNIPAEFKPVYDYYLSCVNDRTSRGVMFLGQSGGYIELPEFDPGSVYMPFSSHLNLLGNSVPYWYYISGNGVVHEQVPSKEKMEEQLNNYLKEALKGCDLTSFENEGFVVFVSSPDEVKTKINDNNIDVEVMQDIVIRKGDYSFESRDHKVVTNSNLGKFYDLSVDIYNNWKETMFLESYGVDILRLYAPVDGTEIGCKTLTWQVNSVRNDLINSLEANIPQIKIEGKYYDLKNPDNKYFVRKINKKVDTNINFMYVRDFPMKMQVWPSEDNIMRADPVGLQEGMGMLGFCYVPYHFVYDFAFPVMIQVYTNQEMFQFPVVVYIEKNKPREALDGEKLPDVVPELCDKKLTQMSVYTYDRNLMPIPAEISFKCFDTSCDIGYTISNGEDASLTANFPQCINGFIIAKAPGYETTKYQISSLNEDAVIITLNKKYKLDLVVKKVGRDIEDYAIVSFIKDGKTNTLSYPDQKEIELTEGQYQVKTYVYSKSSLTLEGSSSEKCIDVPKSGFMSIFGGTEEKCFNLDYPSQNVDFAVVGGGIQNNYFSESELQASKRLIINTPNFGTPVKIEDIQNNYNNVEVSGLDFSFEK